MNKWLNSCTHVCHVFIFCLWIQAKIRTRCYDGHLLSAPAQAQWLGHTGGKGPRRCGSAIYSYFCYFHNYRICDWFACKFEGINTPWLWELIKQGNSICLASRAIYVTLLPPCSLSHARPRASRRSLHSHGASAPPWIPLSSSHLLPVRSSQSQ